MKHLKKTLLVSTLLILITTVCVAQNSPLPNQDYNDFARSFPQIIYHPVELIRSNTPTVCLLKIRVDADKNIKELQLSDSADSLLQTEFKRSKGSLKINLLEKYLKTEYATNACNTYIIPLSYSIYQASNASQKIKISSLYNYSKFDGISLTGNVVFLEPIYSRSIAQR